MPGHALADELVDLLQLLRLLSDPGELTYGMGCRFAVIPVLPSNRFLIAELSLP